MMPRFIDGLRSGGVADVLAALRDRAVRRLLGFTGSQKFLTVQLDITNACNLRCEHCYHSHHSNGGALDLAGWLKVLDQYERLIHKLYLRPRFVLCGGEPTISPLFLPLLKELDSRWPGVEVAVLTNGSRLGHALVRSISGFNLSFQISLDGPDRERHDLIRGRGSFDTALAGLANLQAAGFNACFLATLSQRTAGWVDDFFRVAENCGVSEMNFTRFISQGHGRKLEQARIDGPLSGHELRSAYRRILDCSARADVPTNTDLPLFRLLDENLGANGKLGFQGLVIDYQGNLKVTSRASHVLGNVLKDGLESLFLSHPIMRALRDGDIAGCGGCRHYIDCGGDRNASFAATGSFLKKDPACWLGNENEEVLS